MLHDFSICINTKFVFGNDAERQLGPELSATGVNRVLLHHDGGDYLTKSGLLPQVKSDLEASGITYIELGGVQPNPRLNLVREGIEIAKNQSIDAVIAIGGGSVIDSAKAIGLGAVTDVDVWDFFTGKATPNSTLPVAVILTNPASGSESSQVVVINNEDEHLKLLVSEPVVRPAFAFMNPTLTTSVPAFPTACGIVDMFSHICERYFSPDTEFGVIDYMAEGALRSLVDVGPRLMADLTNYEYRGQIMWISTIAQNNTLGVGREQDWATHAIANELSAVYDTVHGASLSILMCAWMEAVYRANPRRFARFAREVFGIRNEEMDLEGLAREGIRATKIFFIQLGMPTSFSDMNIPTNFVDDMLDKIEFFGPDHAIGSIKRLSREDCRGIYANSF